MITCLNLQGELRLNVSSSSTGLAQELTSFKVLNMSKKDGGVDCFDQINEAEVSDFQEAQILVSIR